MQHTSQELDQGLAQDRAISLSGFYGKHSVWMMDVATDASH